MKKTFFRTTGMLALAFFAATQMARAQEPLVGNIPFAFTAGKMMLPAGEYKVEKETEDDVVLLIRRTDRSAATFALSHATQANAQQTESKLVFHHYGNRYFLTQVWVAGSSRGRELPISKQEKEQVLARNETP